MTDYRRIRTDFSNHEKISDPKKVDRLLIDFNPSGAIPSGLGEIFSELEFLRMRNLRIIKRHNLVNLKKVKELSLIQLEIKVLHPDILFDLPNLTLLEISNSKIEGIPENFFKLQSELKVVKIFNTNIVSLTHNLFNNNLKFQEIWIENNNDLVQILIDFVAMNALEFVRISNKKCTSEFDKNFGNSIQVFQQQILKNCR